MLLSRRLRFGFAFNLLKLVDGVQAAIRAPVKHLKSFLEPSGVNYNPQTNTTEEAYD